MCMDWAVNSVDLPCPQEEGKVDDMRLMGMPQSGWFQSYADSQAESIEGFDGGHVL